MSFKNFLMAVLMTILFVSFSANAQFYKESLEWDGDTSETCITTQSDTTDPLYIPKDYVTSASYGKDYPTKLAFQFNTVEENDSTHITWKYQLSLDGTYWLTAVPIDTMTAEDEKSIKNLTVSNLSTALYVRLIAVAKLAAADTVTISGTFAKIY